MSRPVTPSTLSHPSVALASSRDPPDIIYMAVQANVVVAPLDNSRDLAEGSKGFRIIGRHLGQFPYHSLPFLFAYILSVSIPISSL
jgi:hypothetical protein